MTQCRLDTLQTWHTAEMTHCRHGTLQTWHTANMTHCRHITLHALHNPDITCSRHDTLQTWHTANMTHQYNIKHGKKYLLQLWQIHVKTWTSSCNNFLLQNQLATSTNPCNSFDKSFSNVSDFSELLKRQQNDWIGVRWKLFKLPTSPMNQEKTVGRFYDPKSDNNCIKILKWWVML